MDVAVESRGFGAPVKRTYLQEIRPTGADVVALIISLAILAGSSINCSHIMSRGWVWLCNLKSERMN